MAFAIFVADWFSFFDDVLGLFLTVALSFFAIVLDPLIDGITPFFVNAWTPPPTPFPFIEAESVPGICPGCTCNSLLAFAFFAFFPDFFFFAG